MDYHELLAAAQQEPQNADYHSLRMAYTRSDAYRPYANDLPTVEQMRAALQAHNMPVALEAVQTLLDTNYLDIEAHIVADYIFVRMDEPDRSAFHRIFGKGLLDAIRATGDGTRFETAYIVIDIPEEYVLLRVAGLRMKRQSLQKHDGQWFDVIEAEDVRSGQQQRVYFNVNIPRTWLEDRVQAAFDEPGHSPDEDEGQEG